MTFVSYKKDWTGNSRQNHDSVNTNKDKWGGKMAFSKGKRIEDETSKRIVDLAVNIGCREGADALTVTRLCRELNCDRRVIYNRFRDIDEINLVVAQRCNEELMAKAKNALKPQASFEENFIILIKTAFTYIYEKNSYFQHYTALYKVTDGYKKYDSSGDFSFGGGGKGSRRGACGDRQPQSGAEYLASHDRNRHDAGSEY